MPSYPIYGERQSWNQKDTEADRGTSFESLEKYSTSTGSFYLNDTEESNEDEESSKEEDESEGDKGKSAKDTITYNISNCQNSMEISYTYFKKMVLQNF